MTHKLNFKLAANNQVELSLKNSDYSQSLLLFLSRGWTIRSGFLGPPQVPPCHEVRPLSLPLQFLPQRAPVCRHHILLQKGFAALTTSIAQRHQSCLLQLNSLLVQLLLKLERNSLAISAVPRAAAINRHGSRQPVSQFKQRNYTRFTHTRLSSLEGRLLFAVPKSQSTTP